MDREIDKLIDLPSCTIVSAEYRNATDGEERYIFRKNFNLEIRLLVRDLRCIE